MNTRHMSTLVAAAQHGSINKAALELGLSAPSVKHEIDAIERETGIRIFQRGARGLTVTPAGEVVVESFRRALEGIDADLERARSLANGGNTIVRVLYTTFQFAEERPDVYVRALARYREQHPAVDILLHRVDRYEAAGPSDVLLGSVDPDATQTVGYLLTELSLYAAVSLDHPLAKQSSVTLEDLEGFRLLVPDRATLAHVTPTILPYLDSRGPDVEWHTDRTAFDRIVCRCLTSQTVCLLIGRDPIIANSLAAIPISNLAFRYEIYAREDADAVVKEYVASIAEFYQQAALTGMSKTPAS